MIRNILAAILILAGISSSVNATTHTINAEDFKFTPASLTVTVGDTILWTWDDSGSNHTTTSTAIPEGAAPWDNLLDATHLSFSYVVTQPGNYSYKCTFHETMNMVGSFTATGSPVPVETPKEQTSLNINVNNEAHELHIEYSIQTPALINISILDLQGRLMDALPTEIHTPGMYTKTYNTSDLPKGIYIVQLQAENTYVTKKISLE